MQDDTQPAPPGPAVPAPYGITERALAGVLLIASLALAYICADVLAGGRITRVLSGPVTI